MINDGRKKENANPTIHAVRPSGKYTRILLQQQEASSLLLGQAAISKYSESVVKNSASTNHFFDSNDETTSIQSVDERSVWMALQDITQQSQQQTHHPKTNLKNAFVEVAAKTTPLQILKDAGFYVDTQIQFTLPVFQPLKSRSTNCKSTPTTQRDPFDEEEIFDMIRTINDPEHPLTLEQLNVVNLHDIHVLDHPKDGQSTVHISFT